MKRTVSKGHAPVFYVYDLPVRQFTGKERDAETGLDYFGARYMSAAQGRFTSPDAPFADQHPEDPQSWNLYSYGRNSPLVLVDKDGNAVMLATALAGAAFGGGARAFSNYMSGRPLLENVGRDALIGGAAGATGVGLLNVARNSATIMTAASAVSGFVLSRPGLIQRTGELLADAVAPPGTPSFSSGIGAFAQVAESMSARSAIYQSKITGTLPDVGYIVGGVKFDGFKNGVLLDAKAGLSQFIKNGSFVSWFKGADDLVSQAQRQVAAANGNPIQWHFAEQAAADATRKLLKDRKISGIDIVHTPE